MTAAKLDNSAPASQKDRQLIAGRFRAHTQIGSGRLGDIFAATDEGLEEIGIERQLAIQIIPENIVRNNKVFNQISIGYTRLHAVSHPNIVDFLKFGRDGKLGYLVMKHLDGASLRVMLESAETLPLDEVKPIIRGVGDALGLLHANDMMHGNLTAKNVFVTEKLKVKLLDVLPLDATQAVIGGGATSAPFSRCAPEDDVFGLACLAYEMLSGKHPFNYSSPAEAKLARKEVEPIASLPDREWNALRIALSFDDEQRTTSVEDFMRDFGIEGNEKLQPSVTLPASRDSGDTEAAQEQQPAPEPSAPVVVPATLSEPLDTKQEIPPHVRQRHRKQSPRRAVLLGILLAALGAWAAVGQPDVQIANLINYVTDGATTESAEVSILEPRPTITAAPITSVEQIAVDVPESSTESVTTKSELTELELTESELMVAEPDPAPTDAEMVVPDTAAGELQTGPEPVFVDPIVSVSESDGVARIAASLGEFQGTPLLWWTSEHTARANEDFIAIEQSVTAAATSDGGNVLHVPLINDSLAEPPESFFVSLGMRDAERGQTERIAIVRIDIIDDD